MGTFSATLDMRAEADRVTTLERTRPADLAAIRMRKSFAVQAVVLDDVSFEIFQGETVALIGATGAGKSTLLRCCVGLSPLDGGTAQLFGRELVTLRPKELRVVRAKVGFVFQQHNLVPRLSVLTNVMHGSLARAGSRCWFHPLAPKAERAKAMHYLDLVGLASLAERRADRLSGGQSQRVAIARALMQEPRIVIADEPVASLDPKAAEEVMGLFARLMEKVRRTFIFTSHNLQHALTYSDRLLALHRGTLKLDGPTKSQNLVALRELYEIAAS